MRSEFDQCFDWDWDVGTWRGSVCYRTFHREVMTSSGESPRSPTVTVGDDGV